MTHPVVHFYIAAALKLNYWRSAKTRLSAGVKLLFREKVFLARYSLSSQAL